MCLCDLGISAPEPGKEWLWGSHGKQRDRLKGQKDRQPLALTHFMLPLLGWDTNRGH